MGSRSSYGVPALAALLGAAWLGLCSTVVGSSAEWPMFRGGPALTGVTTAKLPDKLVQLWAFKTGGLVKSSAAIVQNQVFIGSADGNVYSLGLADGKKRWAFKTGGEVESSPLVLDGKVFVGSSDAFLYALEA